MKQRSPTRAGDPALQERQSIPSPPAEQEAAARLGAAQAAEAKFRGLLEAAPDAMVILGSDRTIALVNDELQRMFGYRREELLGRPVEVLIPERLRDAHVKHRGSYFGEPRARPMGAGLDLRGRRKDGTEFPVEISLS
jgi:PAS domain S-box-containing protein